MIARAPQLDALSAPARAAEVARVVRRDYAAFRREVEAARESALREGATGTAGMLDAILRRRFVYGNV